MTVPNIYGCLLIFFRRLMIFGGSQYICKQIWSMSLATTPEKINDRAEHIQFWNFRILIIFKKIKVWCVYIFPWFLNDFQWFRCQWNLWEVIEKIHRFHCIVHDLSWTSLRFPMIFNGLEWIFIKFCWISLATTPLKSGTSSQPTYLECRIAPCTQPQKPARSLSSSKWSNWNC